VRVVEIKKRDGTFHLIKMNKKIIIYTIICFIIIVSSLYLFNYYKNNFEYILPSKIISNSLQKLCEQNGMYLVEGSDRNYCFDSENNKSYSLHYGWHFKEDLK